MAYYYGYLGQNQNSSFGNNIFMDPFTGLPYPIYPGENLIHFQDTPENGYQKEVQVQCQIQFPCKGFPPMEASLPSPHLSRVSFPSLTFLFDNVYHLFAVPNSVIRTLRGKLKERDHQNQVVPLSFLFSVATGLAPVQSFVSFPKTFFCADSIPVYYFIQWENKNHLVASVKKLNLPVDLSAALENYKFSILTPAVQNPQTNRAEGLSPPSHTGPGEINKQLHTYQNNAGPASQDPPVTILVMGLQCY